ncbi:hypothetical protein Y1Q_0024576 [Alligator mississippiensis]|uniref:Uncharacterized protein n=1 Tax=Alligator mississippiensis TaxID=8496 RepID=A0A151NAW7_ALLMI|nr:hypothetical protein Y1Q_0024576 [Alligator mississippiensis]
MRRLHFSAFVYSAKRGEDIKLQMKAVYNLSSSRTDINCTSDNQFSKVLFPVLYTVLFLVGIVMNGLAMYLKQTSYFAFLEKK